jgi:serine/threonine-protein kinase
LPPEEVPAESAVHDLRARQASMRPVLVGLGALSVVMLVGGAVIQWSGRGGAYRVSAGERPLELVPSDGGALRVLATPWAEVWVDGQRIDVTPFARAIPLSPGTHYVTLKHPNAPVEKRQIAIVAGETLTLDVAMSIDGQPPPPPEPSASSSASPRTPTATKGSK